MDVALAIDISGSMQPDYTRGVVQEITERCLALAMNFDVDKNLTYGHLAQMHNMLVK